MAEGKPAGAVVDDGADQATQDLADALGVDLLPAPLDARAFASQVELISPSPGVPESHPLIAAAWRSAPGR